MQTMQHHQGSHQEWGAHSSRRPKPGRPNRKKVNKQKEYVPVSNQPTQRSPVHHSQPTQNGGNDEFIQKQQSGRNRGRRRRQQPYVQARQGGTLSSPYPAPPTFYGSRPVPAGLPGQSVPPGLGYRPYSVTNPTRRMPQVARAPPAARVEYHGDDSRYVASNNCIAFQRGNCAKGKDCEWRHFDAATSAVVETLYDPKSGGPGVRARVLKQMGTQKEKGNVARIGDKRHSGLDAAAETLVNTEDVRYVNENDPFCWDYNSVRGCNRRPCLYVHTIVPYKFVHPYTGEIVDPEDARRAEMNRRNMLAQQSQFDRRDPPRSPPRGQQAAPEEEYAVNALATEAPNE